MDSADQIEAKRHALQTAIDEGFASGVAEGFDMAIIQREFDGEADGLRLWAPNAQKTT